MKVCQKIQKMTLIKKDEHLTYKEFEDVNDLIKWANKNKKLIDIINISYRGIGIIKTQPVCVLWFKVKKKTNMKYLEAN